jgi:hypothetical protein
MGQLARGFYRITGPANLRWWRTRAGKYPVIAELKGGELVYPRELPIGHENDACYFDGNSGKTEWEFSGWRNDHTWVAALSEIDEDGTIAEGWIDNGKMDKVVENDLEDFFQEGDVLYGRREARQPWRMEEFESQIAHCRYNIIDDLNNAIINGKTNSEEVNRFADYLGDALECKAAEVRIRTMCKCGLTYITSKLQQKVHFLLDGLDAMRVVKEADVNTKQGVQDCGVTTTTTKFCTGAEMRRLMRQAMADRRLPYGKDYQIVLDWVWFYLAAKRVAAPWEAEAPGEWKKAWTMYKQHRMSKKNEI